jgi:hypothetical protein
MFINKNSIMVKYIGTTGNPQALGLYERNDTAFSKTTDTTFASNKSYYVALGQYLVEVEYQYNKLWANDSGRNLAGKQTGTLIGIFPKLVCQFRKLDRSELELIQPILDAPTQTLYYYDPMKQFMDDMETYTGDWSIKNKSVVGKTNYRYYKNEPFSISFIAREKRQ